MQLASYMYTYVYAHIYVLQVRLKDYVLCYIAIANKLID